MLYTVSEVSKMLKVNRNYVYKLIKNGELEAVKIGSIKIREEVLNRYVNNNIMLFCFFISFHHTFNVLGNISFRS